jgi:transposase InsO family protein
MQDELSAEILFRHQVVSEVLTRMECGERQVEAVRAVSERVHFLAYDPKPRRVATRTVYRWLSAYRSGGIEELRLQSRRTRRPAAEVLSEKLITFCIEQKRKDRRASIPELIRRARELGIVEADRPIDRTTVYRALERRGVDLRRRKTSKRHDARRFAYPHRMDMVLSDGKHFRAGASRSKRVVLYYLDDATRTGLHLVVGSSETTELFLRGLHGLIERYGLMDILFLDRGPGFIAEASHAVLARIGIRFIHGAAKYPEGHGKIERFNQTTLHDVLRGLDGRADVDPSPPALELRLRHHLETQYNPRSHEQLHKATPLERFLQDPKPLRFPEDRESLRAKFEVFLSRRVSADNVVSIDSIDYELPRGYAGAKVQLRRKLLAPGGLFFRHEHELIELHPVDLAGNARSHRARNSGSPSPEDEVQHPLPPSAADLAFERDYGPVVDPDGGFEDSPDNP